MSRKRTEAWPWWLVRSDNEDWITWDGKRAAQSKVEDLNQSADDAHEPRPWTEIVKMVPVHSDAVAKAERAVVRTSLAFARAVFWADKFSAKVKWHSVIQRLRKAKRGRR